MLQNILNIDGVAVLNKQQQGNIKGGDQCFLLLTLDTGQTQVFEIYTESDNGSDEAHDACINQMVMWWDINRCQYDCAHDGLSAEWLYD